MIVYSYNQFVLFFVQNNSTSLPHLAYWLANCSELLYFVKQDRDLMALTNAVDVSGATRAQGTLATVGDVHETLAHCIQFAFSQLKAAFVESLDYIAREALLLSPEHFAHIRMGGAFADPLPGDDPSFDSVELGTVLYSSRLLEYYELHRLEYY